MPQRSAKSQTSAGRDLTKRWTSSMASIRKLGARLPRGTGRPGRTASALRTASRTVRGLLASILRAARCLIDSRNGVRASRSSRSALKSRRSRLRCGGLMPVEHRLSVSAKRALARACSSARGKIKSKWCSSRCSTRTQPRPALRSRQGWRLQRTTKAQTFSGSVGMKSPTSKRAAQRGSRPKGAGFPGSTASAARIASSTVCGSRRLRREVCARSFVPTAPPPSAAPRAPCTAPTSPAAYARRTSPATPSGPRARPARPRRPRRAAPRPPPV